MVRAAYALAAATLLIAATAGSAEADCTCRARGVLATHGETLCIRTPQGLRLARCDKVSNVASWTFLGGECPQVISEQSERPAAAAGHVHDTAMIH